MWLSEFTVVIVFSSHKFDLIFLAPHHFSLMMPAVAWGSFSNKDARTRCRWYASSAKKRKSLWASDADINKNHSHDHGVCVCVIIQFFIIFFDLSWVKLANIWRSIAESIFDTWNSLNVYFLSIFAEIYFYCFACDWWKICCLFTFTFFW